MADIEAAEFIKSLIIYADDGNYYQVTEEEWKRTQLSDPTEFQQLVRRGVVLAAVPATGPGIGTACYLINLASIKIPGEDDSVSLAKQSNEDGGE